MSNRSYTVMVVGGAHQEVRRHTITRRRLTTLAGAAIGLLIAVIGLSAHYLVLSQNTFQARALVSENARLKERVATLKDRLQAADSSLERLQRYDHKLRKMTHVRSTAPELAIGPLRIPAGASGGGSDVDGFAVPLDGEEPDVADLRDELVFGYIDGVTREVNRQAVSLADLVEYYSAQEDLLASTPSVWPTKGWITSTFGFRSDPFTGGKTMHAGIDLAAPDGTQVLAPARGTVVWSGDRGGYGNMIAIDHGRGIVTHYGHLSRVLVKTGDRVERGHHIGAVGNTGRSTGPHLHYEVRVNGVPVNPRTYVLER